MSLTLNGSAGVTTNSGAVYDGISSGTAVSASGTSIDFTGIPSWVKRITVMFDSISLNGAGEYLVQLGTSGGYVTSGYSSGCGYNQGSNVTRYATNTTGFLFTWDHAAASNLTGTIHLHNITANTWVASGNSFSPSGGATGTYNNAGSIALSGTLNSLRLLSTVGTDSWDAGNINILYE